MISLALFSDHSLISGVIPRCMLHDTELELWFTSCVCACLCKVLAINTNITMETGSIYMCVGLDCYTLSFACFALYEECRTLWLTHMHVHTHDLMYVLYMYTE